jgi:hypothetical protein
LNDENKENFPEDKKAFSFSLKMDLSIALIIWLVIVIVVYLIARMNNRTVWSSIVLGILIAAIVLAIIRPITVTEMIVNGSNIPSTLYWLIMFLTPLIIIIYVISKAVTDIDQKKLMTRTETTKVKAVSY